MEIAIIKLGGALTGETLNLPALQAFIAAHPHTIIVHGGGNLISEFSTRLDLPVNKINGRRVTDAATLQVMVMACAGWVNKDMVARLQSQGINAFGLSGADGALLLGHKRGPLNGIDYGQVGEIDHVNTQLLATLLQVGLVPVVAPVTYSPTDGLLNTNADSVTAAIAAALARDHTVKAWFLMEAAGVFDVAGQVLPALNPAIREDLHAAGALSDGILPKLDNALALTARRVQQVVLGNWDTLTAPDRGTIVTA